MKRYLALLAIPFFFITIAFAETGKDAADEAKLRDIAKRLEVRKPLPGEKIDKVQQAFCQGFLDDLKAGKAVEFVRPVVRTDDYNDPELQKYLGKCPALQLNKTVSFEPKIWESVKSLPEAEQEKYGTVWLTTTDFRLYEVDFDNNPKNGKELLFFGGGNHNPAKGRGSSYSFYSLMSINKCQRLGKQQVEDTFNYVTGKATGNVNGMLSAASNYYVFNLVSFEKNQHYELYLYRFSAGASGKFALSCTLGK